MMEDIPVLAETWLTEHTSDCFKVMINTNIPPTFLIPIKLTTSWNDRTVWHEMGTGGHQSVCRSLKVSDAADVQVSAGLVSWCIQCLPVVFSTSVLASTGIFLLSYVSCKKPQTPWNSSTGIIKQNVTHILAKAVVFSRHLMIVRQFILKRKSL